MACRPNTHRPSFHVNMVGLEKTSRSNSSRYPWGLDAEMMDVEEDEFELWLQQALASGLFCETSKCRKTWSPFKLNQIKKRWRRSSSGLTWCTDNVWVLNFDKLSQGVAHCKYACNFITALAVLSKYQVLLRFGLVDGEIVVEMYVISRSFLAQWCTRWL